MLQEDNFPDKRFVGLIILQGSDCAAGKVGSRAARDCQFNPFWGTCLPPASGSQGLLVGDIVGNWQGLNRKLAGTESRYSSEDNALNSFSYQPMGFE